MQTKAVIKVDKQDGAPLSPIESDDPFTDPTVETVYTFGPVFSIPRLSVHLGQGSDIGRLVKRQDRHDDGSITTTYYLELTEDQYKALGGE